MKHKLIHYEVMTNQVVGVIIGYLIVYLAFPLFDHLPQSQVASISTSLFFVSSYLRSYVLRRLFNHLTHESKAFSKA